MSLDLAIKHARKNPIRPKGSTSMPRFGAVLSDGFSTYLSWNSYRSHPLQGRYAAKTGNPEKIHLHAELSALIQGARSHFRKQGSLRGYTLYVARVLQDGTPALALPCESCWAAITEFGITQVRWTE